MKSNIKSCEVCGSEDLTLALDLGCQPLCDDLIPIGSSKVNNTYPIEIVGCQNCFTFHQGHTVSRELLFPRSYHYRAGLTKDVIDGMQDFVKTVSAYVGGLHDKRVLDIGCNDGSLLSGFKRAGAITCGVEPTDAALDAQARSLDWIHQGYFDQSTVEIYQSLFPNPDIITFTNVFAHINDLAALIDNVKALMGPATKLVIENHYMGSVSRLKQFDTFYHEHPRTYSARSFSFIAQRLDCQVESISFPKRYNGNIRVIIGKGGAEPVQMPDEQADFDALCGLQDYIIEQSGRVNEELKHLSDKYGPLPAKAFPGRAAININLFKIDDAIIDCIYEQPASPKIGHYVPGTKIEIRSEDEFFNNRMKSPIIINLAWHIHSEIESYLRDNGYAGNIHKAWIE